MATAERIKQLEDRLALNKTQLRRADGGDDRRSAQNLIDRTEKLLRDARAEKAAAEQTAANFADIGLQLAGLNADGTADGTAVVMDGVMGESMDGVLGESMEDIMGESIIAGGGGGGGIFTDASFIPPLTTEDSPLLGGLNPTYLLGGFAVFIGYLAYVRR